MKRCVRIWEEVVCFIREVRGEFLWEDQLINILICFSRIVLVQ